MTLLDEIQDLTELSTRGLTVGDPEPQCDLVKIYTTRLESTGGGTEF